MKFDVQKFISDELLVTWEDYVGGVFFAVMMVILVVTSQKIDLKHEFVFYASYHNNKMNQLIHFCCIWPLFFTYFVFYTRTTNWTQVSAIIEDFGVHLPDWIQVDFGLVIMLTYCSFYTFLDGFYGMICSLGICINFCAANYFTAHTYNEVIVPTLAPWWSKVLPVSLAEHLVDSSNGVYVATILAHIKLWILQFIGHGAFEGRAPALLDNIAQALFMAPYFVYLEFLFMLGLRQDLWKACEKQINKNIAEFKKQSKKKQK